MTTSQILRDALSLFGPNGERWVNHPPTGDEHYCLLTAIQGVSDQMGERSIAYFTLLYQIGEESLLPLTRYNDTHTFAEIKALFEKAIASELKREGL